MEIFYILQLDIFRCNVQELKEEKTSCGSFSSFPSVSPCVRSSLWFPGRNLEIVSGIMDLEWASGGPEGFYQEPSYPAQVPFNYNQLEGRFKQLQGKSETFGDVPCL